MTITFEIPEEIVEALEADTTALSRAALEGFALDQYRLGRFSDEQLRRVLGLSSQFDVHAFLKQHGVFLNYSEQNMRQDLEFSDQWPS